MKLSVTNRSALQAAGQDGMFRLMKECGFDACDFMLDEVYGKTDEKLKEYCAKIKALADEADIEIGQTHADYSKNSSDFSSGWTEAFERTVASIKATAYLGAKYCVVHPVRLPGRYNDKLVEENYKTAVDFYKKLIPYLEQYDVICCLENMWNRDPIYNRICGTILSRANELVKMCDELGDRFAICIDTGHGELTQDKPHEMIRECADRIKVVHLHDTDGVNDLHTIPYSIHRNPIGTDPVRTDWDKVMFALKEIGYTGNINFEVIVPEPAAVIPAGLRYLAKIGRYFMSLYDNAEVEGK